MYDHLGMIMMDTHTMIYNDAASMSVFCHGHPLEALRAKLAIHGILTARDLRRIPSGCRVLVTGILVIVHTPPTRSGKRVMFITMEDETGLMDLVVFPKTQVDFARAILTSEVLTVEGRLQRDGKNGVSVSIVVGKVLLSLSGSLSDFFRGQVRTPINESSC
ncbi:MAG: OB-fold nucleic acid binding domain-containing protein [Desulfomonile sp.]|jgi:error-prone DNA polymerase